MNKHKVAIITGAAGGIGKATALAFARKGYALCLVDIDAPGLGQLCRQLQDTAGTQTLACAGDLADGRFMASIAALTLEKWGRIDVLVNNAAWRTVQTLRSMDEQTWEKTLRVCLTAPAFLAKACLQAMEEKQVRGVVINLSSIMSARSPGYSPAYIAAKGGLESLSRELAVAYGRSGIRVLCLKPGNIDTHMGRDYQDEAGDDVSARLSADMIAATPLGRAGYPEEVAQAICWLASEEAAFITGCELVIDGGFLQNFNHYSFKQLQFPQEF